MNILDILAKRDNEWVKMAMSFNKDPKTNKSIIADETARELVQEMYLKLYKYIKEPEKIMYSDDEINTMYVYITLRNLYYNRLDVNKKTSALYYHNEYNSETSTEMSYIESLEPNSFKDDIEDEIDYDNEWARIELQDAIRVEVDSWHYYDAKLFKIIYYDRVSMRQLSKDTGISLSSIFNTIKTCRERLAIKFNKQYNNLK